MSRTELRVLVVDDDEAVLRGVHRVLQRAGHRVTACASIDQARAAIVDGTFDVVVVDRWLNDGTGEAVVELLKSAHPETRVVYMSGDEVHAEPGAVVLQKPVPTDVLLGAVEGDLGRRDARAESANSS